MESKLELGCLAECLVAAKYDVQLLTNQGWLIMGCSDFKSVSISSINDDGIAPYSIKFTSRINEEIYTLEYIFNQFGFLKFRMTKTGKENLGQYESIIFNLYQINFEAVSFLRNQKLINNE